MLPCAQYYVTWRNIIYIIILIHYHPVFIHYHPDSSSIHPLSNKGSNQTASPQAMLPIFPKLFMVPGGAVVPASTAGARFTEANTSRGRARLPQLMPFYIMILGLGPYCHTKIMNINIR